LKSESLTLPAFAKVNWDFRILGKRSDNFHEIRTILQTISLRDQLSLRVREDGQVVVRCDDPSIPVDHTNLVARAASALRDHVKSTRGVEVELTKVIPSQGGLGGGSSNAAITLIALNELWEIELSVPELAEVASQLGADVPFFLYGGRVLGEGIGTKLTPLTDAPKKFLIVVTPVAKVSTPVAYQAYNARSLTTSESISILSSSFAEPVFDDLSRGSLHNDFEKVIFEIEPEICLAKQSLVDAGARDALLAGSGSSVFGIFDDADTRERALGDLRTEAGWRVFSCETISRKEYFQEMGSSGSRFLRSLNLRIDTGA
jgi:4-diphosphocytidyl-2-C-methyl-D-erythritol kinase